MTSHEPTNTELQAELEALKDLCTEVLAALEDDRDFDGAVSRLNEALNGGALTPAYERLGGLLAVAAAQDEQLQFLAAFAAGLREMTDGGAAQLGAMRADLDSSGTSDYVGWLCRELLVGAAEPRACRVCGCTDNDCSGCIERTGVPCAWAELDLCTACVGEVHDSQDAAAASSPEQLRAALVAAELRAAAACRDEAHHRDAMETALDELRRRGGEALVDLVMEKSREVTRAREARETAKVCDDDNPCTEEQTP